MAVFCTDLKNFLKKILNYYIFFRFTHTESTKHSVLDYDQEMMNGGADDSIISSGGDPYDDGSAHHQGQHRIGNEYYDEDGGGEFENDPEYNQDVVRETDLNESEVLPEQGTTRNLLAKFQALQGN